MNEKMFEIFNEVLHTGSTYKVGERGVVIETTYEYWRECINLFLAAAVYYLRENFPNECCYSSLVEILNKAKKTDELDEMFCGWNENRLSEKYYMEFLAKSKKCTKSVIIFAETSLKKIYFNKEKIAEFERVFEI